MNAPTRCGARVNKSGAKCEEDDALVLELHSVLRDDHVERGLRDAVRGAIGDFARQDDVEVGDTGGQSDDFLELAQLDQWQEGVDGVGDADDVDFEL